MNRKTVMSIVKVGIGLLAGVAAESFIGGVIDRESEKDKSTGIKKAMVKLGAAATGWAVADKVADSCMSMVDDISSALDEYSELKKLATGGEDDGNA